MNRRTAFLIAFLVLFFDQLSKARIISLMSARGGEPYEITSFFNIVAAWNRGISFGMLAGDDTLHRWLLVALAAGIVGVLLRWLKQAESPLVISAIGLVSGGAGGNVIDRFRIGAVFDFLDFHILGAHWPAFNVADSAICIGVVLLAADAMLSRSTS